jgi:hypothetical protein
VLEALHHVTGLPIVADYYTRLYPLDQVTVQNQTLFDALNRLADALRLRWNRDGGPPEETPSASRRAGSAGTRSWLQFRSVSYYHDRLKEVPNRLLCRWAAARRQRGSLTLDDLVEIAQLPDPQLDAASMAEGARELFGLQEWELARYRGLRPHLRYLAMLTPEQRRMAMSSSGLLFTRMSLPQQQRYIALALQYDSTPLQSLDELAGATLRVDYTQPGAFQWGDPDQVHPTHWEVALEAGRDGRRVPRPPIVAPTREAALAAARRVDPQLRAAIARERRKDDPRSQLADQVEPAEIYPTKLGLWIIYIPGATNARSMRVWFEDNDLGF